MKQWSWCVAAVVLAGAVGAVRADEIKIKLEGVKCDACAGVLADAVKKVPGAKLKDAPSLTKTTVVVDVDLKKADLGDIAQAVAGADTPHKADEAPAANVVIPAPGLNDKNKKQAIEALKKVKGVDADFTTADVKGKEITVKLADKGGAKLADIQKALAAFTK